MQKTPTTLDIPRAILAPAAKWGYLGLTFCQMVAGVGFEPTTFGL